MNKEEIKQKLKKEKDLRLIAEISYCGKKYIKALKDEKNGISYIYYEIDENEIKDIKDKQVTDELKNILINKRVEKVWENKEI